jgi:hypothetical protein
MLNFKNILPTKNGFYLTVIVVLLIIIVFQKSCQNDLPCPEGGEPIITTKIDTQYIPKKVEKPIYIPGAVEYLPGTVDSFYKDVDTAAILQEYYATRVYRDTVAIDSIGYAYITDTISKNLIVNRLFGAEYTLPVITKETTITIPPKPKAQLYVGVEGIGNKSNPISYFGPSLVLKTKKDQMYTLGGGYGADGASIKAGVLWKLKLK